MPPPDPRPSTVSPGLNRASAAGLPHPNEARNASSGTEAISPASYRPDVIGSLQPEAASVPQQPLTPPLFTPCAACPYFSFTISLMLSTLSSCNLNAALPPKLNYLLRADRPVARATLLVKKAEELAQPTRVRRIPKKLLFSLNSNQAGVFQLLEVMRQRRARDLQLLLNLSHDHAVGMTRQKQSHDSQSRRRAHRRQHLRVSGHLGICAPWFHISTIIEI